jgi:glutamine amidotransferase
MGNLFSVYSAFDYLGQKVKICSMPEELYKVDRIVIPGVGAFQDCIKKLTINGFLEVLNENVLKLAKPTLGICLGMQVMANTSYEGGEFSGLGWFNADVIKLQPDNNSFRIPNIGWNEVSYNKDDVLFQGLPDKVDFYFVHSFFVSCNELNDRVATYEYAQKVTAAIKKDNIFATQFHPEKSQDYGLTILDNFVKWNP